MVGKKWLKLVKSLHQKKYRNEHQLFFVEGKKGIEELLAAHFELEKLFVYEEFYHQFQQISTEIITPSELKTISALKNPNGFLGVFKKPKSKDISTNDWILALDDVRDPGNLGTIIRLCDWFGISDIVCSETTVDMFNPKVVQATMGSISRVNVLYTSLPDFLSKSDMPIYGAYMEGIPVNQETFPQSGILVMGNEGNGISQKVEQLVKHEITIPQYGHSSAESLNVAMATGILLNEIRRS